MEGRIVVTLVGSAPGFEKALKRHLKAEAEEHRKQERRRLAATERDESIAKRNKAAAKRAKAVAKREEAQTALIAAVTRRIERGDLDDATIGALAEALKGRR